MRDIDERFSARLRELEEVATARPLVFRDQARMAFARQTKEMRQDVKKLTTSQVTAHNFYITVRDDYVAHMQKIDESIRAGKLDKILTQTLNVSDEAELSDLNRGLYAIAKTYHCERIIDAFYDKNARRDKRARQTALRIMDEDYAVVAQRIDLYLDYESYRRVTQNHKMTVEDCHAPILRRLMQRIKSRRQIRRMLQQTQRRLVEIEAEMAHIRQSQDGLIARLFDLKIDLVEVLAARQDYSKALEKAAASVRSSQVKQLELYRKKTAKIRNAYVDSVPGLSGLKDVQKASEEVDDVLLKTFDLDARQSNELMRLLNRYRALSHEREALGLKLAAR